MLQHVDRISGRVRRVFVASVGLLAVLLALVLQHWGRDLVTPATPLGAMSLQLAGDAVAAGWMLDAWDAEPLLNRRAKAAVAVGLDFLFIPVYVTLVAFLCLWAASSLPRGLLRTIATLVVGGAVAAGLLDLVENTALLMMLFSTVNSPWPQVAQLSALVKFGLLGIALLYAGAAWVNITIPPLLFAARSEHHV